MKTHPQLTNPDPTEGRGRVLDGSRVEAWSLSRDALDRLLEQLDSDPRRAALQYERVRSKLVKLFEWRGCRFPEELADHTIDRVAHKIESGVVIESEDPYRYFCSVAFYIYKEVLSEEQKRRRAAATPEFQFRAVARTGPEEDELMPCLEGCLDNMTPRSRELVVEYHRGQKSARIQNRARLAEELGVTKSTLRLRVHRMRVRLERCVKNCSEQ